MAGFQANDEVRKLILRYINGEKIQTETEIPKNNESDTCIIKLYTYEWTISNYGMIKPLPEAATSPVFAMGLYDEAQLKMRLSPSNDGNLKIDIALEKVSGTESNDSKKNAFNKAILNLEFIDSNGKTLDYYIGLTFECKYINKKKNYIWRKEESVSRFIQNDSLTLRAKFSLRYPSKVPEMDVCEDLRSIDALSKDMKKLIGDGNLFPDISIKVGGHDILAHKAFILTQLPEIMKICSDSSLNYEHSLVSPTKSATKLNEKYETVCIPNANADVFLSILHYLYSGKIHLSDALSDFGLYEFSKKYSLHELRMMLKPGKMRSHSRINLLEVSFTWYVKDFSSSCVSKFNLFHSPNFKTVVGTEISWNITLYFFDSENIFLSLQRVSGLDSDIMTKFKLIICNIDDTVHEQREFKHLFASNTVSTSHPGFLDSESRFFISPSLLLNDTLTVRCELVVSDGALTSHTKFTYPGEGNPNSTCWIRNLHNLLDEETFTDISLLLDEKEFRVHRAVLAARSPVFARMFESDMAEKISGCVKIVDISAPVMKHALCYIYTGKLGDLKMQHAPELYRTADKYEILDLKDRCSKFIMRNLDAESACEVLILSDLYNDNLMKEAAKRIICRRASPSLLTTYGLELMKNYPHLAHDILENLSAVYCSLPPQDVYEIPKYAESSTSDKP